MNANPKLFHLSRPVVAGDVTLPAFVTPLGSLNLQVAVDGALCAPTAAFTDGVRTVTVWSVPFRLELFTAPAPILLPPGMAVDGALAAIWRAEESKERSAVALRCCWTGGASWSDVGPETGQDLDAQTWTDGTIKVTVGLPDYEAATQYQRDGFEVVVTSIPSRQGHFLCAWAPDLPDDVSTWFAVDWGTERLLAEV